MTTNAAYATIGFAEGSEAHYSIFAGVAEREYVVEIDGQRCMVVEADDDGITVVDPDNAGAERTHRRYDSFRELVIL